MKNAEQFFKHFWHSVYHVLCNGRNANQPVRHRKHVSHSSFNNNAMTNAATRNVNINTRQELSRRLHGVNGVD
jgi:hypothetical protein